MTIYHRHHIVPRHMGGSDDPSNIIELSIEDHAEAHRMLYEQYEKPEDLIAWKALSGQISMSEASKLAIKLGASKGVEAQRKLWADRSEWYEHNAKIRSDTLKHHFKINGSWWVDRKHSTETKAKIGLANSISQSGSKNSQFGSMWITNGSENKKIKSVDIIPEGWYKGRVIKK